MTVKVVKLIASLLLLQALFLSALSGKCSPPPHYQELTECCAIPKFVDDDIIKMCAEEYEVHANNQPPPAFPADQGGLKGFLPECLVTQCIFDSSKLITDTRDIDAAAWRDLITAKILGEWLPILEPLVEKCIAVANERVPDNNMILGAGGGANPCNKKYITAGRCFFHNAYLKCPVDSYKSSNECV